MLLGLDVGTSSLKGSLLREDGTVVLQNSVTYGISAPHGTWAEQDPEAWYRAACEVCRAFPRDLLQSVRAVGLSGQMHGIVCLGVHNQVLRPAIIWADRRSKEEVREIEEIYGWDKYCETTRNRPSVGFGAFSLRWLAKHEPEIVEHTRVVLCSKDYLRFRLCGNIGTDFSDASGIGCFEIDSRSWATPLVETLQIPPDVLPEVSNAWGVAGRVGSESHAETGLPAGTPVCFGGADACLQGVGNGITRPGIVASNVGTAGQVAALSETLVYDRDYRTNTFCHVLPDTWTIFGATLSAGRCMTWLEGITNVSVSDMIGLADAIEPGADGLVFLPYINGERTPHFNPSAAGIFWGLTPEHTAAHLARAVMEGVCLSLLDCLTLITEAGVTADTVIAAGGGSRSDVWVQMQADVFGQEVVRTRVSGDASVGAAVVAGFAVGCFTTIDEGSIAVVGEKATTFAPAPIRNERYRELHAQYRETYLANEPLFDRWRKS